MNGRSSETISITNLGTDGEEVAEMARDIASGLASEPKDLSRWPKYLYDDEGSRLFEEITAQPEYYQTRTELRILQEFSDGIMARTGCREIVELGSGSSRKTRTLIEAMLAHRSPEEPATYSPLDVSEGILRSSGEALLRAYPDLDVHGYIGDFSGGTVGRILVGEPEGYGRLVVFLGGTIGNFVPEERRDFLRGISSALSEDDALLVGVDLVKDRSVLEAAYDDAAGMTASFDKNLLNVINEKLGADFDPQKFTHRAVYDEGKERIEMWLDSTENQTVSLKVPGASIRFAEGEGMRTELSHKFTSASAEGMLEESGLRLTDFFTDEEDRFGLLLARRV